MKADNLSKQIKKEDVEIINFIKSHLEMNTPKKRIKFRTQLAWEAMSDSEFNRYYAQV